MNFYLPARPYQLYFEHRPGYLFAYVHSDTISFEIAKGYWVEILSMLHRRHYKKVLIEKNVSQRLAAHDVFELVSELAHSGCNSKSFAIFDHFYDEEKCGFEETVGSNRGLRLKITGDACEAERWLLSRPVSVTVDKRRFPHVPVQRALSVG